MKGTVLIIISLFAGTISAQEAVLAYPPDLAVEMQTGVFQTIGGQQFRFDLYKPVGVERPPVVIFVNVGSLAARGWGQYTSWSKLVVSRGLAAVTYDALNESNEENLRAVVSHLIDHSDGLGIDAGRLGVWACSANVKIGLPFVLDERNDVDAAVFFYGVMEHERPVRRDVPYLVARAGLDSPIFNRLIDLFSNRAIEADANIELINYPGGQHAFDVRDDTDRSREIIGRTLDFLVYNLGPSAAEPPPPMTPTRLYYLLLADVEKGKEEIERLHLRPGDPIFSDMALDNLTSFLLDDSQDEAANLIADLHITTYPDSPRAVFNQAVLARKKNDCRRAISQARRTLELIGAEGTHPMLRAALDSAANQMISELAEEGADCDPSIPKSSAAELRALTSNDAMDFHPAWSPAGRLIAFETTTAIGNVVSVVRADDLGVEMVGAGDHPAWSPDGRVIYFDRTGETSGEGTDIAAFDFETRTERRLTTNEGDDGGVVPSPDGRFIAYMSRNDGHWRLKVRRLSNGETLTAPSMSSHQLAPSWRPDGKTVAFMGKRGESWDVFEWEPGGDQVRAIVSSSAEETTPLWLARDSLLFVHSDGALSSLRTIALDSGRSRLLIETDSSIDWLAISPDRSRVAFTVGDGHSNRIDLLTVADGSTRTLVERKGRNVSPSWSSDGLELAFATNRDGDFEIMIVSVPAP